MPQPAHEQPRIQQRIQPRFSVGLTGGIGCGKSTVERLFAERGAAIIDTDLIAHQVTAPGGAGMPAILAAFGPEYLNPDGSMDRAKMRALVFSDAGQKRRLESILHPLIRIGTERAASEAEGLYLMFVVPLLVESGSWKSRVDRVLAIDCPEALQVARVMQRSALTEQQVLAIMATQATRAQRRAAADDVLMNDAGLADLVPQVEALHAAYREEAARRDAEISART